MSRFPDPTATGTHTITVDGVRQRYHVAGTGPICVVQPGGPGIDWRYLRMPELEQHLTLVYLEPVGTGDSGRLDNPLDYRVDTWARFLAAVVERVSAAPVLVLGHSHGGFVAQHLALLHPDRVSGLILYSTAAVANEELGGRALALLQERARTAISRSDTWGLPQAFVWAMPQVFMDLGAARTDAEREEALRRLVPAYFGDPAAFEPTIRAFQAGLRAWVEPARAREVSPFDVRASLDRLRVPALVLTGELDFICGPVWGTGLAAAIPGARYREFGGTGHFVHLEQPTAFAAEIAGFVAAATPTVEVTA